MNNKAMQLVVNKLKKVDSLNDVAKQTVLDDFCKKIAHKFHVESRLGIPGHIVLWNETLNKFYGGE